MRRRTLLIIALVVLLIAGGIAVWLVLRTVKPVIVDPKGTIESQLSTQLNRKVTVGSARIVSTNQVVVTGLKVAQGKSFTQGTLFTARRVTIQLNLLRILTGAALLPNIREMTFTDPSLVLIRNRQGVWNIEDLLRRPPVPPTQRFRGLVRIDSGNLTVRDYAALLPALPAVNSLSGVNGSLDFRPAKTMLVDLSGRGVKGRIGQLTVRGPLGLAAPKLTHVTATVTDAAAGYWLDYFSTITSWTLRNGIFDATGLIYQTPSGRYTARGTATVRGSSITSPYLTIPLTSVGGPVTFVGTTIHLDTVSARLRTSPVHATGTIKPNVSMDLRVASDRMDPLTLQHAIRPLPTVPRASWPTPMAINARVFGPTGLPKVSATASIPRAIIYGVPATGITASGSYSDHVIRISDLRAGIAGGTGRFSSVIRLATGAVRANGTLNNARLAEIRLPVNLPIAGVTDATFSLQWLGRLHSANVVAQVTSGRVGPLAFSSASAKATMTGPRTLNAVVQISGGSVRGISIQSAHADLALRGSTITISQGMIDTPSGTMRTSGSVTTAGGLSLAVNAADVNVRTLFALFGYRQVSGTADFSGRLTGTITSPILTGTLTARNGTFRQIRFNYLTAQVTATPRYVLLTNATIQEAGTTIATTGFIRVPRAAPPEVSLTVTARRASLAQLAALAGVTINVAGTANVNLTVTGQYPNLRFAGTISVTNATIAGFTVDSARLVLSTVGGRTVIDQLTATRDGMRLVGSGTIGPTGALDIALRGEDLNLSLLNPALAPFVVVSGPASFTATVTGTLANPLARGDLASTAPVVNSIPFDRLAAAFRWNGVTISLSDASLTRANTTYSIARFSYNTRTGYIALDAAATSVQLQSVLALVRNSPYLNTPKGAPLLNGLATIPANASGDLNASLSISGPVGGMSGTGQVSGTNIVLGPQTIDTLRLGFVEQRSLFRLGSLALLSPGVNVSASARYVAAEPTSATAQITDTQLSSALTLIGNLPLLSAFAFGRTLVSTARSTPRPATGLINATVSLADLQTAGTGTITATIADLSLGNQPIGTVVADATLADGVTTIRQLNVTGPTGTATVQGTIGPNQGIALTGHVEGISLALIAPFVGIPSLTGTLVADFQASGTTGNPRVNASLTATNISTAYVRFRTLAVPSLVIEEGRLTATQITASTDSSQILASASLPFSFEPPFIPRDQPIDIRVSIPTQDLAGLAQFISIVQSASGTLSMSASVTGTIANPAATGSLVVTDGRLNVVRFNNDFTDIQIDASFSGSTLQISRFTGASSEGGTFTVTGAIELPSLSRAVVDTTLTMDALRLDTDNLTGFYGERITMTTTGLLNITESLRAPLIAGDLVVSDAVIRVPATTPTRPTASGAPTPGPNPRFDVTLNLASNVTIERGAMKVTVQGPVSVAGTLAQPNIVGTVALTAGSLSYPPFISFTLVPGGTATFVWQAPAPPSIAVDLTAVTHVIAQSPFTTTIARYTIYIYVSGTIDNLAISTSSSPPGLSEDEALALIFQQAGAEALSSGVPFQQIIEQQLGQTLLGVALPGIFQGVAFGPFAVGITPGVGVPLQAWVAFQVTPKFSISFLETLIGGMPYQILEIDYTLSPKYSFAVQFQQNNNVLYLMQAGWRF